MSARTSIVAPPSKKGDILRIIFLLIVISLSLWQLSRAFSHAFLMNEKHEGVVMSGEAAGQRSGARATWSNEPAFNYVVKETGTGAILKVNHVSELHKTGDSVTVYTYPDGTEGHFKTGFDAFFSHDLAETGMQGRLTIMAAVFLPCLLLLFVVTAQNIFRKKQ